MDLVGGRQRIESCRSNVADGRDRQNLQPGKTGSRAAISEVQSARFHVAMAGYAIGLRRRHRRMNEL
ncbi:hypothetical protein [Bradyrhizobium sp. dw_78]|uniref:hypothetical protein n=1 Tax=Bradyrhizobium sp. dw_78 TaxID=2719793 RepID=UPI00201C94CD|nr:hypothetical protein [Bradyrhizobium sp. dw_78]